MRTLHNIVTRYPHHITPFCLAVAAGALSLQFTVRACRSIVPAEAVWEILALGTLWEAAKLYFGPRALLGIFSGTARVSLARAGHLTLLGLVAVLVSGSVAASYMATTAADDMALRAADSLLMDEVIHSPSYVALQQDIAMYDARIAARLQMAERQTREGFPQRADATEARISEMQAMKDSVVAQVEAMRKAARRPREDAPRFPRAGLHIGIALTLELISIISFVLFHAASSGATDTTQETTAPRVSTPSEYERLKSLIGRGDIRPEVRHVMAHGKMSQRPAQRVLKRMCKDGVVVRIGRRYRRA